MFHCRIRDARRLAEQYDLVVTTYATLSVDYKTSSASPLHKIKWHRVVYDEGEWSDAFTEHDCTSAPTTVCSACKLLLLHVLIFRCQKSHMYTSLSWQRTTSACMLFVAGHTVKNATAGHSRACVAINAERRWICTGTPLSNDITDLLGQFSVLQMEPFSSKTWFTSYIKSPFLGE